MATKKPAVAKARSSKPAGKATQTRAGAGPALAERTKDAKPKPAFGKAAPKRVVPAAESKASKPAAAKSAVPKARSRVKDKDDGSVVAKVARAAKTTAAVAVGAVVATAKLATPARKRKDGKAAK